MPSALDLATLAIEVAQLASTEGHRWGVALIQDTLRVYVTLSPVGSADVYCLRLDFGQSLSDGPPSVAFCAPDTHVEGRVQDWPRGLTNYFKVPPDRSVGWICNPWTREGRGQHGEWRSFPWRPNRAIWSVATAMQDILDSPGAYTGRAQ